MKHGNTYYLQLSRLIFNEEPYKSLSPNAKWLYIVLKELEQRYTSNGRDYFHRSNEELAADAGFSLATLKRAKRELLQVDLVEMWQSHFILESGKKSEKHITVYRIAP